MPHYLFVTGRLAEQPLRRQLESLAPQVGFAYSVAVMPITIAALITPRWLARRLDVPDGITAVIVPGHCLGDLTAVEAVAKVPVQRGPRDLRELPEFYGRKADASEYGDWDIEIIARIGNADELTPEDILNRSARLDDDGADVILLAGCGRPWPGLSQIVQELQDEIHRVAVANVTPRDLLSAASAGVELVFPADADQQEVATGVGHEVVLAADNIDELAQAVEAAERRGVRYRIAPGLQPIGLGLAESVERFFEARRRWPESEFVMPLEPVTRTMGVDSAALHVLFVGLCQELRVGAVVVSQDTNWCRTAVRECRLARQVSRYTTQHGVPAGDIEPGLLMLRDGAALEFGRQELDHLAKILKDPSPRLFAEDGRLRAVSAGKHLESEDPYDLFDQIVASGDRAFDASQAFYLGYEMAKAMTALTLGKTYRQDEALDWGMLTQRELTRLERRALRMARSRDGDCEETKRYFEEDGPDEVVEESDE